MIIFFCHLLLFGTAVNVIFLLLRLLLKEVGLVSKSLRDKPNVSRDIDWTSKIGFHLSSSISSFLLKMSTPRRRVITLPNFPSATDNCSMLFLQISRFVKLLNLLYYNHSLLSATDSCSILFLQFFNFRVVVPFSWHHGR